MVWTDADVRDPARGDLTAGDRQTHRIAAGGRDPLATVECADEPLEVHDAALRLDLLGARHIAEREVEGIDEGMQLVRTLAAWRPDLSDYRNVTSAYRIALKSLGRRYLELHDEIADLDAMIAAIVEELAPSLVARNSIGRESAAQLLLTAGDNVDRIRSESSFAALCGVSPVPASSGKVIRHRLNRGGDRAANSALHVIAIGRLRTDPKTKAYIAKKIAEGHSKLEALRCLKRYIAREVYALVRERNREIAQTRIVT